MKKVLILLFSIISVASISCSNQQKSTTTEAVVSTGVGVTGPDAIIYKTRADYRLMVPVIMNAEKTDIVSYPAPGDLKRNRKPALPDQLENGFLFDNRGINENVAFLNYSYAGYIALEKTPSKEELLSRIIDRDPLDVMYNCGKRSAYDNLLEELNAIILTEDFSKFRKLK